jgi:hypothetical protein
MPQSTYDVVDNTDHIYLTYEYLVLRIPVVLVDRYDACLLRILALLRGSRQIARIHSRPGR